MAKVKRQKRFLSANLKKINDPDGGNMIFEALNQLSFLLFEQI